MGSPGARRAALQQAAALLVAPAAQDGGEGPRVRFNEDLGTRPAWLPPASASGSAVADWWRQQQQQAGQQQAGYAHCWWARPQAAEGAAPEAAAWRQRCLAELCVRVAWALAVSEPLASAADAAALAEQLQPLLAAPADAAGEGVALQAAACRALLALLPAVAGGDATGDAAPAQELSAACSSAAQRIAGELAAVQGLPVLPGGPIAAAAGCAADCGTIATVFGRLKQLAAKAAGTAAAAGSAAEAATEAAADLKAAAAAAVAAQPEEQRVAAALAAAEADGADPDGAPLWAFEPELQPRAAVAALVKAQVQALRAV